MIVRILLALGRTRGLAVAVVAIVARCRIRNLAAPAGVGDSTASR
jgi:hypothetical protein